ncbi:hypothetical protein H8S90_11095 [Olivibacter sp. SDN3]|uniref:hypothetical protein n=1 Tax=Olivibacter sp. SDN3 TaxID=2764720 RepID=UPI001650F92D|nr:hypothetical protein [Olivibacter sp. SDN3]QNL52066.1 hypothetical protein H8S90_11095 [Olivibacter sp. SDN3]
MRKKIVVFLFGAVLSFNCVYAQIWKEYSSFNPFVGVQLGAQGIGIEGGYPLSESFNARLTANFFPSSKMAWDNKVFSLHRSNIVLLADWQPLYGRESWIARKWIVSAGAGYYFDNKLERFLGSSKEPNQLKDYDVEWSQFRPYIGTGLNGIKLSQRFNFAVNVGYFIPTEATKVVLHEKDPEGLPSLEDKLNSFPNNAVPGLNIQVGISYIFF